MKKIKTISFIGAGNVATRLATAFHRNGLVINEIFSRSLSSAQALARKVTAKPVKRIAELSPDTDIIIIAVSDHTIKHVVTHLKRNVESRPCHVSTYPKINPKQPLVVHTSGSTPMDILQPASGHYGVFYPLQTLQKSVEIDFSDVPVCIEANNDATEKLLVRLARSISSKALMVDSEQRRMVHIAAVFACNFSNHMYAVAEKLLQRAGRDFSIMQPLIKETARRAGEYLPSEVQTGPAARKDQKVITLHLKMLRNEPELKKIYRLLSNSIMNRK